MTREEFNNRHLCHTCKKNITEPDNSTFFCKEYWSNLVYRICDGSNRYLNNGTYVPVKMCSQYIEVKK